MRIFQIFRMKCTVIILAVFCLTVTGTPESDKLLDSLLAKDGIELPLAVLDYRRRIFEGNWLVRPDGEHMSLEDMYSETEIEKQNGAKMVNLADKVIPDDEGPDIVVLDEKDDKPTPKVFDARHMVLTNDDGDKEPMLNKVQNQQNCGNCYLQVFVGALEIAYTKATGKKASDFP